MFENIKIENKSLKEIEYKDNFFNSLRKDYYNFDKWYINKMHNNFKAYVTYNEDNKLSSFLLLKKEEFDEEYEDFDIPFNKSRRIKICTLKVTDTRKNIGKQFMEIIEQYAKENNIYEIYITTNNLELIEFLKKYDYNYYGNKKTKNGSGKIIKEKIFIKKRKK